MDRQEPGTLSTFITGAVVGAGIALLFAPQAGVELRRLLREYTARAQDEFDKTMDHGIEVMDRAIERGQKIVEKGKDSWRETGRRDVRKRGGEIVDESAPQQSAGLGCERSRCGAGMV